MSDNILLRGLTRRQFFKTTGLLLMLVGFLFALPAILAASPPNNPGLASERGVFVDPPYTVLFADYGDWIHVYFVVPSNSNSEQDRATFQSVKDQIRAIGLPAVVSVCTDVDVKIFNCTDPYGTTYVQLP